MTAYYNELEPYAAQWLRNLIASGHIAPGEVDERSILDVHPDDIRHYAQCHFFAGIGVWSLALRRAGWPDDRPVWTGSCPCQPFSEAGKGAGFADERHLWPAWFWLIGERRPPIILGEQVASKAASAWADLVQDDLEGLSYALGAIPFPAASVGAPHIRERMYWAASDTKRCQRKEQEPHFRAPGRVGRFEQSIPWHGGWEAALTRFRALDDGIARRVAATDAARNAIVAPQAQVFIEAVMECMP